VALNQTRQPAVPRGVVFHARDLSKTYTMGQVQIHALRDVNLDIYEGGTCRGSSG
jgi:putative ABC transport system ATP-binding protein